ncbi:MAG: hypothetical protein RSB36_02310 [Hydrogenoanaerobacterium sp.]
MESFSADEIRTGKIYSICAYLGILVLVPILAARQNRFAMYHANQGLVLLGFSLLCNVIDWLGKFNVPFAGLVGSVGWLLWIIFVVMGIINVINGVAKPLPIIGQISIIK